MLVVVVCVVVGTVTVDVPSSERPVTVLVIVDCEDVVVAESLSSSPGMNSSAAATPATRISTPATMATSTGGDDHGERSGGGGYGLGGGYPPGGYDMCSAPSCSARRGRRRWS